MSRRSALCSLTLPALYTWPAHATVGGTAIGFRLRAVPGTVWQGMFDLAAAIKTGPVVLSFFATWCRPCEVELPVLQKQATRLASQGLTCVAVAIDGPESAVQIAPLATRLGVRFPVVHDADSRVASRMNPRRMVPFLVAIGKGGRIIAEREGWTPEHQAELPLLLDRLVQPA